MARSGLYKSDVRKARDSLLAQGQHPSVDAVRIALGNTGSKTTIHKYLKELEEEEGGVRKVSISEALQDLVERLAARLHEEADARIEAIRAEHAEKERQHAATLSAAQAEIAQWRDQAQQAEVRRQEEQAAHNHVREQLRQEELARRTAEQRAADLQDRLADKEAHCQSLEDKHRHAYEALEHYRQSVKEQRDQDQRRHEQQLQQLQAELRQAQQSIVVKQEDLTRLNQDATRLVTDLRHTRQALRDAQEEVRRTSSRVEALQAVEQRNGELMAQLAQRDAQTEVLREQLAAATEQNRHLTAQVRELELTLAQAQARCEAQQGMVSELRAYLDQRSQQASKG